MRLLRRRGYVPSRDRSEPLGTDYWRARIHEKLGQTEEADEIYRELFADGGDSFYLNLAIARRPVFSQGKAKTLLTQSERSDLGSTAAEILRVSDDWSGEGLPDQLGVVHDLLSVGLADVARTQLSDLSWRSYSRDASFGAAGRLAWQAQDYTPSRSIIHNPLSTLNKRPKDLWTLIEHQKEFANDWKVYYPLAYDETVRKVGENLGVDKFMLLSIMRAESFYKSSARSGVGARGLMQIMPYTGLNIAREIGKLNFKVDELEDPDVNIVFGGYYLSKLLKFYDGSLYVAAAAYNAGPKAVNRWLKACKDCELDEFIEAIPYWETRQYVKKVVKNYAQYTRIYGGDSKALALHDLPKDLPSGVEVY